MYVRFTLSLTQRCGSLGECSRSSQSRDRGSGGLSRPNARWVEIRKRRVADMRGYPQWRWHLDEVFVKVNGKLCYLWRAVDQDGEVLRLWSPRSGTKLQRRMLFKRIMKKYGAPGSIVTDTGLGPYSSPKTISVLPNVGHEVGGWLNNRAENSHQPFRRRERAMQRRKSGDAAEIQLSSCPGAQLQFNQGAPSRHEASLQAETLCCLAPSGAPSRHRSPPARWPSRCMSTSPLPL